MSVREILENENMKNFALGRARVLFGDNCAACGGGRVNGDYSFPNLTDDDWLYGSWSEKIVETAINGRQGAMPAKGGLDNLQESDINNMADMILALSQGEAKLNNEGILVKGAEHASANKIFQETCFACHGRNAKGGVANGDYYLGAANLTDSIWRFGGDKKTIVETITYRRNLETPLESALVMFVFGMGTVPSMMIAPFVMSKLSVFLRNRTINSAALLIVVVGVFTIFRGTDFLHNHGITYHDVNNSHNIPAIFHMLVTNVEERKIL